MEGWTQFIQYLPDFGMEIKEAIQDGNMVWVYSRITGLTGTAVKDSLDMGLWDNEGNLVKTKDVQRTIESLEA